MLDDYMFVASILRAGTIKEYSKVWQREVYITTQGDWIPTDDALEYLERTYPVWCPSEQQLVNRKAIFETQPSQRQYQARPLLGGN